MIFLKFTHFFGGQSQKRSKFSNKNFDRGTPTVRIPRVNGLNTNRSAIKFVQRIGK